MKLYSEVHGEGDDLVLISGHMTSALSWREFWKPLTTSFRVTLLDNRGIGRSPNCESPYTVCDMAQDTLETLTDLGIEKFHLFGHSMGGNIALECAKQFPQRIKKLILGSTFAKIPINATFQLRAFFDLMKHKIPRENIVSLGIPWLFGEDFLSSPKNVEKEITERLNNPHLPTPESAKMQTKALLDFNARSWLSKIDTPTLVISGNQDLYVPFRYSEELAKAMPKATLFEIEGAGHGIHVEKPAILAREITNFL